MVHSPSRAEFGGQLLVTALFKSYPILVLYPFIPGQTIKPLLASLSNDATIELEGKGAWIVFSCHIPVTYKHRPLLPPAVLHYIVPGHHHISHV